MNCIVFLTTLLGSLTGTAIVFTLLPRWKWGRKLLGL